MAINTLPDVKTVVPRGARKAKRARDYAAAQAAGQGDAYLAAHPKFARNMSKKPGQGKINKVKNPDVKNLVQDEKKIVQNQVGEQIRYTNPTYTNAEGTTSQVTYDQNGNPIYTESMSDPNRQILAGQQNLSQSGLGKANELTAGYSKFANTGSPEERARIEEAAYKRLTRNVDRDYNKEFDDMEQRMYNRGIPLDPTNPAYQREKQALDEKYNTIKENAAQNATILGKGEAESAFSMGLQSHQQGLADTQTLSGLGSGVVKGETPGYVAPNVAALQTPGGAATLDFAKIEASKDIARTQADAQKSAAQIAAEAAARNAGSGEEDDSSGLT